MSEEVEKQPTTEIDFALEYAEERKMRMALETRLCALLFEYNYLENLSYNVVYSFLENKKANFMESIRELLMARADLDLMTLMNLFFFPGKIKLLDSKEITENKITDIDTLPKIKTDRFKKILAKAEQAVFDEYDEMAKKCGLNSRQDAHAMNAAEVAKRIEGIMLERLNDGKKQESEA